MMGYEHDGRKGQDDETNNYPLFLWSQVGIPLPMDLANGKLLRLPRKERDPSIVLFPYPDQDNTQNI